MIIKRYAERYLHHRDKTLASEKNDTAQGLMSILRGSSFDGSIVAENTEIPTLPHATLAPLNIRFAGDAWCDSKVHHADTISIPRYGSIQSY